MADLPDGSPTWAVKSPMIRTAVWPELLELAELAQHDREAEVDVGRGGVDAELDAQRPAGGELAPEVVLGDEVDRAGADDAQLLVDGKRGTGHDAETLSAEVGVSGDEEPPRVLVAATGGQSDAGRHPGRVGRRHAVVEEAEPGTGRAHEVGTVVARR